MRGIGWRRGFQPRQVGVQTGNPGPTLTRLEPASPKDGADEAKLLTRQDAASPNDGGDRAKLLTRLEAASPWGRGHGAPLGLGPCATFSAFTVDSDGEKCDNIQYNR